MGRDKIKSRINWPVFILSGGVFVVFVIMSLITMDGVSAFVDVTFNASVTYFGAFWQLLLLATFFVGLVLAFSKYGKVRLGNVKQPEYGFFKWAAIVVTSGLGAGAIFGRLLNRCTTLWKYLQCIVEWKLVQKQRLI